ncbi:hypothetical protein BKI52_19135 [marine bacterium AO1-C]|nr:hypothetical protein BKI52_19135 [marine bacterium AO1-C]
MIDIESLADKIDTVARQNNYKKIRSLSIGIDNKNLKKLVIFLLREYWFPIEYLLIASVDLFEQLSLSDWKDILKELTDEQLSKYPTALDIFLITSYVMLEIDFIKEYADLKNIDKEYQKDFLEDYIERPGRLNFGEHYKSRLKEAKVDKSIFKNIKQNLLNEGATEAIEVIMPSPDIILGIQVQHMQFDPPNWSWAKKCTPKDK